MHGVFSRFLKKFPDSAAPLRRTQTLTTVGLFLAIQMSALSSYGVIQLNDSLENFAGAHWRFWPTAMLFGPVAAAASGRAERYSGLSAQADGAGFPASRFRRRWAA